MVLIPIKDEDSESSTGGYTDSSTNPGKGSGKEKPRARKDEPDTESVSEGSVEDTKNIDWNKTSQLAEEISQNFDSTSEVGVDSRRSLEMGPTPTGTWPPGTKKTWPPASEPDPFVAAAALHRSPVEDDDDESIPFEKSTEVGVMHGDQIERGDFEKIQRELERVSAELNAAKDQIKENYELAQRKQAELANYKRRAKQDMEDFKKHAVENLLVDLIPVIDSIEKAVWSVPKGEENTPLADGIRRTLALLLNTLTRYKVNIVGSIKVPFDPSVHACLYFEDTDEYDDNTVLEIYQNGYTLGDRLIRPAMVKLSRKTDSGCKESVPSFSRETVVADSTGTTSDSTEETSEAVEEVEGKEE